MMDGAEIGWGTIVSISVAVLTSALAVGANNQRNKRTAQDVEELKRDHAAELAQLRVRNDALNQRLNDYQLVVEKDYTRKSDLTAMEARLVAKVDEIRLDVSKRGINHAVNNAVAAALASHVLVAKGKIVP